MKHWVTPTPGCLNSPENRTIVWSVKQEISSALKCIQDITYNRYAGRPEIEKLALYLPFFLQVSR